jgi:hypothetical protein
MFPPKLSFSHLFKDASTHCHTSRPHDFLLYFWMTPNKYLLISSFQKSLRRGLVEHATILWDHLKDVDRFFALYRLSISCIEDVGLGNLDGISPLLLTALRSKDVKDSGGDAFIASTIKHVCEHPKDRSACDVAWMSSHTDWPHSTDPSFLSEFYRDERNDLHERVLAGWLLTGTKKIKHHSVSSLNERNDLNSFLQLNADLGVDARILSIVQQSYGYHKEPHLFALPLLSLAYRNEENVSKGDYKTGDVICTTLNSPSFLIEGLPILSCGVDGHTREGKVALSQLSKDPEVRALLLNAPFPSRDWLMKTALFKAEGQQVDQRLFYPTASKSFKLAQRFSSDPNVDVPQMTALLKDKSFVLHGLREFELSREHFISVSPLPKSRQTRFV